MLTLSYSPVLELANEYGKRVEDFNIEARFGKKKHKKTIKHTGVPSVPLGRGLLRRGEGEPVENVLTITTEMWITSTK